MRWLPIAAAPSGLLLKLVGRRPRLTRFPGDPGVSLVNAQHRMSLLNRGGPQGRSTLEPVAFCAQDGEQKLPDVLSRSPLPSATPSSNLRHLTSHCHAQVSALLKGQV